VRSVVPQAVMGYGHSVAYISRELISRAEHRCAVQLLLSLLLENGCGKIRMLQRFCSSCTLSQRTGRPCAESGDGHCQCGFNLGNSDHHTSPLNDSTSDFSCSATKLILFLLTTHISHSCCASTHNERRRTATPKRATAGRTTSATRTAHQHTGT
jgi:hypothetical protein